MDKFYERFTGLTSKIVYDYENYWELFREGKRPIIEEFSNDDLSKAYTKLSGQAIDGEEYDSLEDHLLNCWLKDQKARFIWILGDSGTGKTSLCLEVTYELAKKFQEGETQTRIPLFLTLREYNKYGEVNKYLISELRKIYGINLEGVEELQKFISSGQVVLFLDGFDEMAIATNEEVIKQNFKELSSLVVANSKVVVTSRTQYFSSTAKFNELLTLPDITIQVVEVSEFGEPKIKEYLKKNIPEQDDRLWNFIRGNKSLKQLAKRPMYLHMMSETIPRVPSYYRQDEKTRDDYLRDIDAASIYDFYIKKWFEDKPPQEPVSIDQVIVFLEQMAFHILCRKIKNESPNIHISEIPNFWKQWSSQEDLTVEHFDRVVRTSPFLNRDESGYYKFSHESFMEFLVAKKYVREIYSEKIEDFGQVYYNEEIFSFVLGLIRMNPRIRVLHKLLLNPKQYNIARARIHIIIMLGRLRDSRSIPVLQKVIKTDPYSRVSGHAAEILYNEFDEKDAFHWLIDSLREEKYADGRTMKIPDATIEKNEGWSPSEKRRFNIHDPDIVNFFVDVLSFRYDKSKQREFLCYNDDNLHWYAASVLSRVSNLPTFDFIDASFVKILLNGLNDPDIERIRTYSAESLGWLLAPLHSSGRLDEATRKEALKALRKKRDDKYEDIDVRKAASIALMNIEKGLKT